MSLGVTECSSRYTARVESENIKGRQLKARLFAVLFDFEQKTAWWKRERNE